MSDEKRPIEQAFDLAVYAPLGFVLEARKLIPTFVERGRAQVQMAKVVGQFAVKQGQAEAGKRLAKAQDQAMGVIGEFGLGSSPAEPAPVEPRPVVEDSAPARSNPQSGDGAEDLAIPSYDSLAASQVIPRLESLSAEELAAVARYERAHRARKTILGKINQIQGS